MPSWAELLEQANPEEHIVQLYGRDDQLLTSNVSRFVRDGLERGEGVLVLGTPAHRDAVRRRLQQHGTDPSLTAPGGRLLYLDAEETLARFMAQGEPDRERFEQVVRAALAQLRQTGCTRVRAFGEMVGLLWEHGQQASAIRLEEYWDELVRSEGISLFCAYPIDAFGGECEAASLQALLGVHTHLLAGPRTMLSSRARC